MFITSHLNLMWLIQSHTLIKTLVLSHPYLFTLAFALVYGLLLTFCLPGSLVLDIMAGLIYGPWLGLLIVLSAYSGGTLLNCKLLNYLVPNKWRIKAQVLHTKLLGTCVRRTQLAIIGLRLLPVVPFWLLNSALVLLGISRRNLLFTTVVGRMVPAFLYVMLGHGLAGQLTSEQPLTLARLHDPMLYLPLAGLSVCLLLPAVLKLFATKSIKDIV